MITLLLTSSLLILFHAYVGYPITLLLLRKFRNRSLVKYLYYPKVTIIVAIYNEENIVNKKINNTLALIYPSDKLQIIFVSDGSNDKTNDIIEKYKDEGIELLKISERKGKEYAQKEAVQVANGDILVFTDAGTFLDSNGIAQIVSNFADDRVGCVSSEDCIIGINGNTSGESLYVKYEMWLRRLETDVNSLVGLSGSFFAARKTVCFDFSDSLDSDFRTLLNCIKQGLRGISDPLSIGYYQDISDPQKEYDRKVRTVLRGITVLLSNIGFLNIFKYGLFSYQLFCHKLMRWMVPFACILATTSIILLSFNNIFYLIATIVIIVIGAVLFLEKYQVIKYLPRPIRIISYFVTVNVSIIVAWIKYFKKEKILIWEPTKRNIN